MNSDDEHIQCLFRKACDAIKHYKKFPEDSALERIKTYRSSELFYNLWLRRRDVHNERTK